MSSLESWLDMHAKVSCCLRDERVTCGTTFEGDMYRDVAMKQAGIGRFLDHGSKEIHLLSAVTSSNYAGGYQKIHWFIWLVVE